MRSGHIYPGKRALFLGGSTSLGPSSPWDPVCSALLFNNVILQESAWDGLSSNRSDC